MVFQSYALFPHLTVGGKRRLRPAHAPHFPGGAGLAVDPRPGPWWGWALRSIVTPPQLSGGQQQRVALAVGGITVHIGARVMAKAGADEVLVSGR